MITGGTKPISSPANTGRNSLPIGSAGRKIQYVRPWWQWFPFWCWLNEPQISVSQAYSIGTSGKWEVEHYIDGLVQERRNSIANALELRLSCTNPSICVRGWTLGYHRNQQVEDILACLKNSRNHIVICMLWNCDRIFITLTALEVITYLQHSQWEKKCYQNKAMQQTCWGACQISEQLDSYKKKISWLWDFMRSYEKTFLHMLKQGLDPRPDNLTPRGRQQGVRVNLCLKSTNCS